MRNLKSVSRYQDFITHDLTNYIYQNLCRPLSMDELSEYCSLSLFYFQRIFKIVMNESAAGFIRRIRLEFAAQYLLDTNETNITAIAHRCGYSSSQNFARCFKQKFGVTPSEYRSSKLRHRSLEFLTHQLQELTHRGPLQHIKPMQPVYCETLELPDSQVAYIRKQRPYNLRNTMDAFAELRARVAPTPLPKNPLTFALYWDVPLVTQDEKCRLDACVELEHAQSDQESYHIQTVQGGLYRVCHFEFYGGQGEFNQAWVCAIKDFTDSAMLRSHKPVFARFDNRNDWNPELPWSFDICIPIERNRP
ncbi:AraC family transcriptional regulator [Dongshaea marina]|uniref:AraC family transcriptional regulator n=1 Tax=Dongshaea marina TaxID=2047966 RepID=UPI00131F4806|nr:helix-turn-helix domain-containing protein [Dongshaea marina]